ncbi:MAG: PD-(D/E)XK nuclease family transposase [Trichodesmium sp. St19_bin1]|nr:PD-(D/E)XK nuclease family transposase [Trichodesmium sp. St19_bin1]
MDVAFKIVFASEQIKEILMSFLNSIIYDSHPTIKDKVCNKLKSKLPKD